MSTAQAIVAVGLILILVAVSVQSSYRAAPSHKPLVALGVLGGLVAGTVLGMVLLAYYGDAWDPLGTGAPLLDELDSPTNRGGPPAGGMMGPIGPATKQAAGGPGGGGPNPKTQLAALVTKLDQVLNKPIAVNLDAEGQAKLSKLLDGLDEPAELTRDEAKKRLDGILELLQDQRASLEATGYRWPGSGRGGGGGGGPMGGGMGGGMGGLMGPSDPPNPFQESGGSASLKSLRDRLQDGS
jgi:hypothetical protein